MLAAEVQHCRHQVQGLSLLQGGNAHVTGLVILVYTALCGFSVACCLPLSSAWTNVELNDHAWRANSTRQFVVVRLKESTRGRSLHMSAVLSERSHACTRNRLGSSHSLQSYEVRFMNLILVRGVPSKAQDRVDCSPDGTVKVDSPVKNLLAACHAFASCLSSCALCVS